MPKNAQESKSKSKMRLKSARKPLQDVSNAKTAIKSASTYKKIPKDDGGQAGDDSLDRLLLVHSDISSLLQQIDELVVEALQLKGNDRRKEIKQFADVLSDMKTSLKPWVSRFQKIVLIQSTMPENDAEQLVERKTLDVSKESTITGAESPEETKWESLVSPSPLVSWRAGCNTESGRQLFLLTPMPQRKALLSKCKASSLHAVGKIPPDEVAHPISLSDAVRNLGNDLQEGTSAKPTQMPQRNAFPSKYQAASSSLHGVEKIPPHDAVRNLGIDLHEVVSAKPTPSKMSFDIQVSKAAVDNPITGCASPEKVSNPNCSLVIMTPCMKMSSAFSRKKSQVVHKCTPFPTRVQSFSDSEDSESSSDQSYDDLKLKYPELNGITKKNQQKEMAAEDSPNWIDSPPKTCAVIGLPKLCCNEPLLKNRPDHCLPLESSSDQYPELNGIKKQNLQKKVAEEDSPNWIVSPPKSCAVIGLPKLCCNEPLLKNQPDRCLPLETTAVSNHQAHFHTKKAKESEGGHAITSKSKLQDIIRTLDLAEFTPMVKEPMSSMRMGKHPGENTLKKELWTKFEAATAHDFCFNGSLVQNSTKKGFLDILDEASDA